MANPDHAAAFRAAVEPTPRAAVTHWPLRGPGVRLSGGLLAQWQVRNRDASLPLALRQLKAMGKVDNLRLAIAGAGGTYRGPEFMDSDLYKTLEAIGWKGTIAGDGAVNDGAAKEFCDEVIGLLEKTQLPDGYLNSYVQVTGERHFSRLASSHELYCAGHLIQAGIAHARAAGSTRLLELARRFADHLVDVFAGGQAGLDGHPLIETALVELYRQTGNERYLGLASQFVEQRGHGRAATPASARAISRTTSRSGS